MSVRAARSLHFNSGGSRGYSEIQKPRERYTIVDLLKLGKLCGFREVADFQQARRQWVSEALSREMVDETNAGRRQSRLAVLPSLLR